jgi:hypothetical protein
LFACLQGSEPVPVQALLGSRASEPLLDALGNWGSAQPRPSSSSSLTATSVLLFLRDSARAHHSPPTETYRVQLDDRVWTLSSHNGELEIKAEDTAAPAASIHTDPETLNPLLLDPGGLDTASAPALCAPKEISPRFGASSP